MSHNLGKGFWFHVSTFLFIYISTNYFWASYSSWSFCLNLKSYFKENNNLRIWGWNRVNKDAKKEERVLGTLQRRDLLVRHKGKLATFKIQNIQQHAQHNTSYRSSLLVQREWNMLMKGLSWLRQSILALQSHQSESACPGIWGKRGLRSLIFVSLLVALFLAEHPLKNLVTYLLMACLNLLSLSLHNTF